MNKQDYGLEYDKQESYLDAGIDNVEESSEGFGRENNIEAVKEGEGK